MCYASYGKSTPRLYCHWSKSPHLTAKSHSRIHQSKAWHGERFKVVLRALLCPTHFVGRVRSTPSGAELGKKALYLSVGAVAGSWRCFFLANTAPAKHPWRRPCALPLCRALTLSPTCEVKWLTESESNYFDVRPQPSTDKSAPRVGRPRVCWGTLWFKVYGSGPRR